MSYSIKDLKDLVKSPEFKEYKEKNIRFLNLGEKIYTRRKDLGFTQSELGKLSGIPQNKVSQLESGTYGEPGFDIIIRLSSSLNISLDYLNSDNITRRTVEMYNYILSRLENVADIMQYMKIPYFIDINSIKSLGKQISNFEYIRWNYGPFDKKVYNYQQLFSFTYEKGIQDMKFFYLSEEDRSIIDNVLQNIPKENGEELKKMSYNTEPMLKIGVTLGDNKRMGEILSL